jgi:hypothetical protein
MNHENARKRVCALCLRKTKRTDSKVVDLTLNDKYCKLVTSSIPLFSIKNDMHPTALCSSCSSFLRKPEKSRNSKRVQLQHAQEFFKVRRIPGKIRKDECNCEICTIATSSTPNACGISNTQHSEPVQSSSSSSGLPNSPPAPRPITLQALKQIQVENSLTQTQLLGVTRGFRYASCGALEVQPGLKQFLTEENKMFEDLFEVRGF